MRLRLIALSTIVLTACGGGGGGAPAAGNEAVVLLHDAILPSSQDIVALQVTLDALPEGAALMQFDLATDAARLGPAVSRSPVEALLPRPTVESEALDSGMFRVLYGDGRDRDPQLLSVGAVLRLHLQVRAPRQTGTVAVELRDVRLADAEGNPLPVRSAPAIANVTIE